MIEGPRSISHIRVPVPAAKALPLSTLSALSLDKLTGSTLAVSGLPVVSVVIPAFNEETRLERGMQPLLDALRQRGEVFEMIIVDDGSSDGTLQAVRRLQQTYPEIRLEQFKVNRGKGAAVRHGALMARGSYILLADADGATDVSALEQLRSRIDAGAEVAIGSRRIQDKDSKVVCPLHRRLLRYIFNLPVRLCLFDGISDSQCGFKMFTAETAACLFSRQRCERFSFDMELLYLARRAGLKIDEVPVSWSNVEGSKVHLIRDGLRMLLDVRKIRRMHSADDCRKSGLKS